jgi:putative membrane protein
MKRLGFVACALTAVLAAGCNKDNTNYSASNGTVGTAGDTDRTEVKSADKDFVRDLAIANMAEVDLGKMALQRSQNADVKKFGQMMVDDHSKALAQLKDVASAHNIPVPTDLDDKHISLRDKLSKLNGNDFDREYASAMASGHEDVADTLESRIDKDNLAEYKARFTDRAAGKKVDETAHVIAVRPEQSDNVVTTAVNQWAADAYPVVQAHLEAAKVLDKNVKR